MHFVQSTMIPLAYMLAMMPLSANAHMIMASPAPFGSPNNSPLLENGSDFPCKAGSTGDAKMNEWPVGSTQKLTFQGTAVHGGGSCQIAVSTDKVPTKDSKWKVIHSIEGGCPAAVEGNLEEAGPSYNGGFPFVIPSELPDGELTMAWTWFNRIGNREMYMNCASVTVSGGSSDSAAFEGLPDMAVANIGTNSCKTTANSDYTFENPGKYITKAGSSTVKMVPLCGGAPVTGGGGDGSGSGNGSGGSSTPQQPAAPANPGIPSSAPAATQAPTESMSMVQSTLRTIVTVTAPTVPFPTAPSATTIASAGPSPLPPAAAPGTTIGFSPPSSNSTCSPDGATVCSPDGTHFAVCNWGKAVFMPVAAGTKCQDGQIAKREYKHRNMRSSI